MIHVELEYYRASGKFYGSGEYTSIKNSFCEVFDEVRKLLISGKLPGLCEGHSEFITRMKTDLAPDCPYLFVPPQPSKTLPDYIG